MGIRELWKLLGTREKRVFMTIGLRLLTGQRAYGHLTNGKKEWKREAQEEAMDMAVYLAAQLEDTDDEDR